jgi:TRAP-type uncharacterized transport system substrate-binding protein
MKKRILCALVASLLVLTTAAGCGQPAASSSASQSSAAPVANKNYSIVSSATGGLWYAMVGAAASLWSDEIPYMTVNVEGTAGSVENARRFASGEADFGMIHANHLVDALNGTGVMEGNKTDAAMVMCQAYDSPQYFTPSRAKISPVWKT